jgi:hypothetical protein
MLPFSPVDQPKRWMTGCAPDDVRECRESGKAHRKLRSGIAAIALVSPAAPRALRPAVATDPRARSVLRVRGGRHVQAVVRWRWPNVGRRRPCPDSTPVARRATRGYDIRRIRRGSRRSSPSSSASSAPATSASRRSTCRVRLRGRGAGKRRSAGGTADLGLSRPPAAHDATRLRGGLDRELARLSGQRVEVKGWSARQAPNGRSPGESGRRR